MGGGGLLKYQHILLSSTDTDCIDCNLVFNIFWGSMSPGLPGFRGFYFWPFPRLVMSCVVSLLNGTSLVVAEDHNDAIIYSICADLMQSVYVP